MRWAPLPSARLLPIVSRGAYRDTGYHSSVANSTPGTVAGIGSACAQAALIYLPPPFPILSLRHTDSVPADILLSQPMLPNPLSRDQIAYRHRLPRITNDARTPLRRARGSFFWPSSAPVTTFVASRLIGLLDDERTLLCTARSSSVYDYFAMTVYIADGGEGD